MTIEKEAKDIWNRLCGYRAAKKEKPYLLISAALQKKQDRIEEMEKALNITMCVYCGFTAPKDANVIAKHIIEDCEKRPDSLVNMTKVLEDFKEIESRIDELEQIRMKLVSKNTDLSMKIEELESALKGLVDRLEFIHNDQEYIGVWVESQVHRGKYTGPTYEKELDRAKKAIGGGE